MIPLGHQEFIDRAVDILKQDARIRAIALCGSYMTGNMDEYSDLDFMLAVESESFNRILEERIKIAGRLGELLSAFPGDHIGVPDLLICLFDKPLIHADFNFFRMTRRESVSTVRPFFMTRTEALRETIRMSTLFMRPSTPSGWRTASGSGSITPR